MVSVAVNHESKTSCVGGGVGSWEEESLIIIQNLNPDSARAAELYLPKSQNQKFNESSVGPVSMQSYGACLKNVPFSLILEQTTFPPKLGTMKYCRIPWMPRLLRLRDKEIRFQKVFSESYRL